MFFSYEDLQKNIIMAKTYSFYGCQIPVRVLDKSGTVDEWKEMYMWVSVRLEDSLYKVPGVKSMTGMSPETQIKRNDVLAKIYPEYQISDAIKKGFVHKLNITLIPKDTTRTSPQYGNSYKTTIVVGGDRILSTFIPNVLEAFEWKLGTTSVPYIAKPNSISPVGGRKNKEKY
jgi:hypothetical protein